MNAIPKIYGLGVLLVSHATISVFDIPSESVILAACWRIPASGDQWAPEWKVGLPTVYQTKVVCFDIYLK